MGKFTKTNRCLERNLEPCKFINSQMTIHWYSPTGRHYFTSKSTTTLSVFGWLWQVRIYPCSTSSSSRPQWTSMLTSPDTSLALQVQQTPPLHAKGRSAPCFSAASRMVVSLFSARSKSKERPSSFTVMRLCGPPRSTLFSVVVTCCFCPGVVNNSKWIFFLSIPFASAILSWSRWN